MKEKGNQPNKISQINLMSRRRSQLLEKIQSIKNSKHKKTSDPSITEQYTKQTHNALQSQKSKYMAKQSQSTQIVNSLQSVNKDQKQIQNSINKNTRNVIKDSQGHSFQISESISQKYLNLFQHQQKSYSFYDNQQYSKSQQQRSNLNFNISSQAQQQNANTQINGYKRHLGDILNDQIREQIYLIENNYKMRKPNVRESAVQNSNQTESQNYQHHQGRNKHNQSRKSIIQIQISSDQSEAKNMLSQKINHNHQSIQKRQHCKSIQYTNLTLKGYKNYNQNENANQNNNKLTNQDNYMKDLRLTNFRSQKNGQQYETQPQTPNKQKQVSDYETKNNYPLCQLLIQQLNSKIKINYVKITSDTLVKYRKQYKRLRQSNQADEIKNSQFKVKLNQRFVSVYKTIKIHFIIRQILKKQWRLNQLEYYNFWIYKGSAKSLHQSVINFVKNKDQFKFSKQFVNLYCLQSWYQLAHLLSWSTNLVFVLQKKSQFEIIQNIYNKSKFCCQVKQRICLCLKFKFNSNQKICCQSFKTQCRKHSRQCKYTNQSILQCDAQTYNQNSKKGIVGIYNNQNDCFMNTALQCLAACQPLTEYFIGNNHLKNINTANHFGTFGLISTRYGQFLESTFTTSKDYLHITRLKQSIRRWDNKYSNNEQQDSQQFLIQFLDWLKQDLNLNLQMPIYKQEDQNNQTQQSLIKKAQKAWNKHLQRNNSIIQYLMAGILRSSIQCKDCLYQSHNFQTFLTLPLPVIMHSSPLNTKFSIKVGFVQQDFSQPNKYVNLQLQSYSYQNLLLKVKKIFRIDQKSDLIGIYFPSTIKSKQITSPIQGSQHIKSSRSQPGEIKIIFLKYKKQDLSKDNIKLRFNVRVNSKSISYGRYLFFTKQQGSSCRNVFKKLLKYFFKNVYKNQNSISSEEYFAHFLKKQHVPFKVTIQSSDLQIAVNSQLSFKSLTTIQVNFQNPGPQFDFSLYKKCSLLQNQQQKEISKQYLNSKFTTVYDCLRQFQKTDIIDRQNGWNCCNCGKKSQAYKKLSIYKAPQILILFFKRFSSEMSNFDMNQAVVNKISKTIEFPHVLDLNNFVQKKEIPYTNTGNEAKYSLFAVANHHQISYKNPQSGHYTAYVNHYNQWYEIDDADVKLIGEEKVFSKDAYILFYKRISK